jgi:glutathione S-transferase
MTRPTLIGGSIGSPYTRKMRAILRYRRIPHQFLRFEGPEVKALPKPPLPLQPCIWLPEPDGSYTATSDSSFQLRTLEERVPGRSILPDDPALAFLDRLVEDYADEWVTKMMFHYRWGIPENVENAAEMLPCWSIGISDEMLELFEKSFVQRQVDRLSGVVTGSLELCGPIIEASYERLLHVLHDRLRKRPFLWGARPAAGDFGLHGQLTQLVQVEPSSMRLARQVSKRLVSWVDAVDDLSGWSVEDGKGWVARDELGEVDRPLFAEIGRTYAPFMVANARALDAGDEQLECHIDGRRYWQNTFRYQGKCLQWLREAHAELSPGDRRFVDARLEGTGCEVLFA